MNKLIIIGNGFDLAHGLKTSYNDFLKWYWNYVFKNTPYSDSLISTNMYANSRVPDHITKEWVSTNAYDFKYSSKLFEKIAYGHFFNWVDIENTFAETILNDQLDIDLNSGPIDHTEKHNKDFAVIRENLIKYLRNEETENIIEIDHRNVKIFFENVHESEKVCLLNFNYTNTAQKYYEYCKSLYQKESNGKEIQKKLEIINIHGNLYNDNEEVIFGIGDEHNSKYREIKDNLDINSKLKYSKSFWYQRNTNYNRLLNYINSLTIGFDIEVFGHSCGLSDRTLLKFLFEHKKLRKIKLHHYGGKDGYIRQSYDVWRHFEDSQLYRERLEPFEEKNEILNSITINDE